MVTKSVSDLGPFAAAYIEAALWSSTDNSTPSGGEPLDRNYGLEDIDLVTLDEMTQDCARFEAENAVDLAEYNHPQYSSEELGGHDFWLSRNGHGSGFFDRNELPEEVAERLQKAARKYGNYTLYIGDDGKIYGMRG